MVIRSILVSLGRYYQGADVAQCSSYLVVRGSQLNVVANTVGVHLVVDMVNRYQSCGHTIEVKVSMILSYLTTLWIVDSVYIVAELILPVHVY